MHKTVELWNPFYECYIDIDKNIASLIYQLWEADIHTSLSCENDILKIYDYNDTCIWITFPLADDLEEFIEILSIGLPRHCILAKRLKGSSGDFKWDYSLWIDDNDDNHDDLCDKCILNDCIRDIDVYYSVRFPGRDYPHVLETISEYNRAGSKYEDEEYEKIIRLHDKTKTLFITT